MSDALIRSEMTYDPLTGEIRRRGVLTSQTPSPEGYLRASVGDRSYLQHRIAWFLQTGAWPRCRVDHINGNRSDNRFANLRECDISQNLMNAPAHRDNQSGFKGVTKNKKRWAATVTAYGKSHYLGTFDTPEEAHTAYAAAASKIHGEFARVA